MDKQKIFAVFNDADDSSASLAGRLLALGIGDRATAKPLAMEWACNHKKYKVKMRKGQRGMTLPRNSSAERAMYRVLDACFPKADAPKPKAPADNKTDPVAKLLKKYSELTGAEKRRFMTALTKLRA